MLIDWFTVVAQTANFLTLVWLMKRYLYQPILTAIDAREARIAAELKNAEAKKAEATKEREDFRQKNVDFEQHRDALLNTTRNDAKVERQNLLEEARKDADILRAKFSAAIQSERDMLVHEMTIRIRQEVFAIARQALADLATVDIEVQMCNVFTDRLRTLENTARSSLAVALKSASEPALVRSAFELPPKQRGEIQQALTEVFGTEIPIKFDTTPSLVCGIELSANGQKVPWSINDYLSSLDRRVIELIAPPGSIEAKATSTPEPVMATMPASEPESPANITASQAK